MRLTDIAVAVLGIGSFFAGAGMSLNATFERNAALATTANARDILRERSLPYAAAYAEQVQDTIAAHSKNGRVARQVERNLEQRVESVYALLDAICDGDLMAYDDDFQFMADTNIAIGFHDGAPSLEQIDGRSVLFIDASNFSSIYTNNNLRAANEANQVLADYRAKLEMTAPGQADQPIPVGG